MGNHSTRAKRKPFFWLIPLLLIFAAGAAIFTYVKKQEQERIARQIYDETYIVICGRELRRDATDLDLRSMELTPEQFEEFRAAFPAAHIRWSVPLSDGARDSDSAVLRLASVTEEDVSRLGYFPRLRSIRADGCRDYPLLLALRNQRSDLELHWTVDVNGTDVGSDRTHLILPASAAGEELCPALAGLPLLRSVRFTEGSVPAAEQDLLLETFPELEFHWNVELLGRDIPSDADSISFAGQPLTEADIERIRATASRFPALTRLDLTDCGHDRSTLQPLAAALPGVTVVWTMDIYGLTFPTDVREMDLTGRPVWDRGALIEDALPCFPLLEKVIMTGCGLNNQEMDEINNRHEDVWFVWTVYFSIYSLRTDATNFIAARFVNDAELYSGQCAVLKYCTDLQALDLGHKNLDDLSFLYDLPKLKYLILVENDLYDITPIGSLKELKYLEIFWTKVEDISPLVNCTKLEDLNICYIYAKPKAVFPVLMQMPWLQRLWYCGNALTPEQVEQLRENMPDCEMYLEPRGEATGGTWRTHPHYYEMRDFFGMYYMPGGTNGVDEHGSQIVIRG